MPQFPDHDQPDFNVTQAQWPTETADFDIGGYDNLVHFKGSFFVHYRAMRCPVGMTDAYDARQTHPDHVGCSNGFIYTRVGTVVGMFTNNSKNNDQLDVGNVDQSPASVTLETHYSDNGNPVFVAPFDRLFHQEESVVVPNWQTFEVSGQPTDRLSFPAVIVGECMDADGIRYTQGVDFNLDDNGLIVWTGQHKPGRDVVSGHGKVVSVWYLYRPFYYVKSLTHELRMVQITDPITGERKVSRANQAVSIQREYIFRNKKQDEDSIVPNDLRQSMAPAVAPGFGPR